MEDVYLLPDTMILTKIGEHLTFEGLNRETFMGLPGLLADSFPDTYGRALFDRWRAGGDDQWHCKQYAIEFRRVSYIQEF